MLDMAPPAESHPVRAQQVALLELLLNESEADQRRAYILKANPRGNFDDDKIPVYANSAEAGTTPDEHKVYVHNFAYETACALYVFLNPLQRGRWMLNTKHFKETALLQVVHRLGSRSFEIFDIRHRPISNTKNPSSSLGQDSGLVAGFVVPAEIKAPGRKRGEQQTTDSSDAKSSTENDVVEQNKTNRADALTFWRSNAGGMLLVLATALEVLSRLFRELVAMSATKWDRKQQAREATGKPRSYRLFEAASGSWTKKFLERAHRLMWDPQCWSHLPESMKTEKNQSYAYSTITRLIAGIIHHVGTFELFPFALFALLCVDPRERRKKQSNFYASHCAWWIPCSACCSSRRFTRLTSFVAQRLSQYC